MLKLFKNNRGQLQGITRLLPPLVVVVIALVVGFLVMAQAITQITEIEGLQCSTNFSSGGYACNATRTTQEAMDDIPGWLPIIIITSIGIFLLMMVKQIRA